MGGVLGGGDGRAPDGDAVSVFPQVSAGVELVLDFTWLVPLTVMFRPSSWYTVSSLTSSGRASGA